MKRKASVDWNGGLRDGEGKITSQSGALSNLGYSFGGRFENQAGTNPEELLASAHAACFTMALNFELERKGFKPKSIHTDADVSLEKDGETWAIPAVHLNVTGEVPGANSEQFIQAAERAKKNCPVSRLFRADITLQADLLEGLETSVA